MSSWYLFVGFVLISASVNVFSLTDYALHFPTKDRVNDYVNIWGMPSLTQFTVCLWMKTDDTSYYGAMFTYGISIPRYWAMGILGAKRFYGYINDHSSVSSWPVVLNDGKWHHVCVSWENIGGHLKFYKDGTLFGQHSAFETGFVIKSGKSVRLARSQSFYPPHDAKDKFVGMLTNVNVWDHVLSPGEIKKMSKSCLSGVGNVYKWSDFIYGLKGETRVVIPSPCKPMAS